MYPTPVRGDGHGGGRRSGGPDSGVRVGSRRRGPPSALDGHSDTNRPPLGVDCLFPIRLQLRRFLFKLVAYLGRTSTKKGRRWERRTRPGHRVEGPEVGPGRGGMGRVTHRKRVPRDGRGSEGVTQRCVPGPPEFWNESRTGRTRPCRAGGRTSRAFGFGADPNPVVEEESGGGWGVPRERRGV